MKITFEGKKKVVADYKGYHIVTDQPVQVGGEGSAPAPFDLFVASLGTCAGFYVRSFCDQRSIPTYGIRLELETITDKETHLVSTIDIKIYLPVGFPEKYKDAVVNAANLCTVKRHLHKPPTMLVSATIES